MTATPRFPSTGWRTAGDSSSSRTCGRRPGRTWSAAASRPARTRPAPTTVTASNSPITPANSTCTGPTALTVASYSTACGGGTCIPQGGTNQQLDSLGDRIMYRLAYRNFGDHESLVTDQSVTAGSSTGVRWYEFRMSGGNPAVFQQGTYAPDSTFRWMGSIAMDHDGNIALGYSHSSSTTHPSIRFTRRAPGDPP